MNTRRVVVAAVLLLVAFIGSGRTAGEQQPATAGVPDLSGGWLRLDSGSGSFDGTVKLWDLATGAPIGDGLAASTGTAGLPVLTATTPHGGRTVLVTGTRHGHRLRIWEPETGAVGHIALDVALTCLATAGPDVIVGHDRGVLRLALTRQ